MTQEIIVMASDSGMELYGLGKDRARFVHHLETFAKLVAEAERERIKQDNAPEIEKINAYIEHAMREVQRLGQEIEATKRTWVGLTDEEKGFCVAPTYVETVARIEAKLKEKNT